MDKTLVLALPKKRPYTLIEAVFSFQVDLDNATIRGFREYSRIWGWSVKKVSNFIRNKQATKTEQAKNTQETVKFRFVVPSRNSRKQAGNKQETKEEQARNTTKEPNTILDPQSSNKEEGNKKVKSSLHSISLPFKSYKALYEVKPDVAEAIAYFMKKYKKSFCKDHPNLKLEQWDEIVLTLFSADDGRQVYDLDEEGLKAMIDRHFVTEYQEGCNYSILHFNQPGVKVNRMFEVAY